MPCSSLSFGSVQNTGQVALDPGECAVLILGGVHWHVVADLMAPDTISLLTPRSHAPDLVPLETTQHMPRAREEVVTEPAIR